MCNLTATILTLEEADEATNQASHEGSTRNDNYPLKHRFPPCNRVNIAVANTAYSRYNKMESTDVASPQVPIRADVVLA